MILSVLILLTDYIVAMSLSVNSKAQFSDTGFYKEVVILVVSDAGIWEYCLYYDLQLIITSFSTFPCLSLWIFLSFFFLESRVSGFTFQESRKLQGKLV
jgi:hypothetical protein